MTRSLKFARLVEAQLREGSIQAVNHKPRHYLVAGRLDTELVIAPVEVEIKWLFRDLKRHPPRVRCRAAWMRTGAEWHNAYWLCWVLDNEWRDAMSWRGKPVSSIMNEGLAWVLSGVRSLINQHYTAHLEGLDEWPSEWPHWRHYEEGVRDYVRDKRRWWTH